MVTEGPMAVEDENQIFHLTLLIPAQPNPSLRQYPAGGVASSALKQEPQGFGLLKGHLQSQSHNEDNQTGYRRFRVTDSPSPHQASDQHQRVVCWSRQCRFRAQFVVQNTTSYVRFQKTGSKTDPCGSPRSLQLLLLQLSDFESDMDFPNIYTRTLSDKLL